MVRPRSQRRTRTRVAIRAGSVSRSELATRGEVMRRLLVLILMVLTIGSLSGPATASTLRVRVDRNDSPSKPRHTQSDHQPFGYDDVSTAPVLGSISGWPYE